MRGVAWRLDAFDLEVLQRQVTASKAGPALDGPGWPPVATRTAIHGTASQCSSLAKMEGATVHWMGCYNETPKCYEPANASDGYIPDGKLQDLGNYEGQWTETFLRTGFNAPPCCRHHILEILLVWQGLVAEAVSYGVHLPWGIGSGTSLSAQRTTRLLPWEFDADVFVKLPDESDAVTQLLRILGGAFWAWGRTLLRLNTNESEADMRKTACQGNPYIWLLQRFRAFGYKVELSSYNYWIVHYSAENDIGLDIFWANETLWNLTWGGDGIEKTVELEGHPMPYYVNGDLEYGQDWVIPNRGPECVGRCQSMDTRPSRLHCACVCSREPSSRIEAAWNLETWHVLEQANGTNAQLARGVLEDAAALEDDAQISCLDFPAEGPDDPPERLEASMRQRAPQFTRFIKSIREKRSTSPDDPVRCKDVKRFCYGWFGALIRPHCSATCDVHSLERFAVSERLAHGFGTAFKAFTR